MCYLIFYLTALNVSYSQIESDFSFIHGVKNDLFDKIEVFVDLMISTVLPSSLTKSDDIAMLHSIKAERSNLHASKYTYFVFIL